MPMRAPPPPHDHVPRRWWWWLVGLCGLRWLPTLFVPFWSKDEGFWWAVGHGITNGGLLFRDATDHKPPFFLGLYGLAIECAGALAMPLLHLLVALGVAGIVWLLYRLMAARFGARVGFWTIAAYLFLQSAFISQEVLAANSENIVMPLVVAAIAVYVGCYETQRRRDLWWVGLLLGIAIQIRQTGGFLLPVLVLHLWSLRLPTRRVLLLGGQLVIGCLAIFGLTAAYFWWRGTWSDYWFWFYTMSRSYVGEPVGWRTIVWEFTWHTAVILAAAWPVWWLVGRAVQRWRTLWADPLARLWLLCSGAMLAAVAVGWRFSHHYYIHLFPFAALLAVTSAARCPPPTRLWPWSRRLTVCLLLAPAIVFTGEGYARWVQERHGGPRPHFHEAGRWLQQQAASTDRLFVWGYYPEIYAAAGLRNAGRFVETHFLTGQVRESRGTGLDTLHAQLWQWFWDDMTRRPPEWIVDTSRYPVSGRLMHGLEVYPDVLHFVQRHYIPVATIDRMTVYRRRP